MIADNENIVGDVSKDLLTGLVYLATPYSRYRTGLDCAFADAAKLAADLLRKGLKVYSPIAHTHPIAHFGKINPHDHKIWLPFDQAIMDCANCIIVAHMDGWEDSYGIAHEIKYFAAQGKPIYDLDPLTMKISKRGD